MKKIKELPQRFKNEKYFMEIWRRELSGRYTNEVTKEVLSSEEFGKYLNESLGKNKGFIIDENI